MFTISFTEERLEGVNAAINAYNKMNGTNITVQQYLQVRANQLADQALMDHGRDVVLALREENKRLKAELETLKLGQQIL